jgi:hypothetical protein
MTTKRKSPPRPEVQPAPVPEEPEAQPAPAAEEPEVLWPEPAAPPPARSRFTLSPRAAAHADIAITVAGLLVSALLGAALALIEAFYSPLRVHGVRVPVSLVMALVTNPLLGWFAYTTTRHRLAALLPAATWCVVWILSAGKTSEGDLIITQDNWVGLLTLFAGPLAFAIGIYVSTLRHRVAPARTGSAPPAEQAPPGAAGS